jgi:hypothetical protein
MAGQPMTDLDKKLQEIALMNWKQFSSLIGEDAMRAAKICLLRQNGKSYGEIQQKLGITKAQVEYTACNKCDSIPPTQIPSA